MCPHYKINVKNLDPSGQLTAAVLLLLIGVGIQPPLHRGDLEEAWRHNRCHVYTTDRNIGLTKKGLNCVENHRNV